MSQSLDGQNIKRGEVQRQIKRILLGNIDSDFFSNVSDTSNFTASVMLENLAKGISVSVTAGAIARADQAAITYPASPGTLQLTPITRGDGNDVDLVGNPVFSSPNFSGPLTLPNGWEFATMVPKTRIDVAVNTLNWPTTTHAIFVLDILLEWTGDWWDPGAVSQLLNRVTVTPLFNGPYNRIGAA